MRIKESAPKKSGFLGRLRNQLSHMFSGKKEIQEPEKKIESEPVKAEQNSFLHQIAKSQPKKLIDPVERYIKKVARRAARREAEVNKPTDEPKKPKDAFGILLDSQSETDFQAALAEKEAGSSEEKPQSISKIILSYPVKPQDKCDLHRLKAQEALIKIDSFIRTAHQRGFKTLEIITGKGIHSKGGKSALRDVTEEKISELKKEGLILSFRWEHQRKRKSGAMIVFLHR